MPNATPHDADIVLKLYDLRREAEMRKARNFFAGGFWPNSLADVEKVVFDTSKPEQAWFRQVLSYWDMAIALVLNGALNEQLFLDTQGEAFFVYAKLRPFIAEYRTKFNQPEFLANYDKLIERSPEAKKKADAFEQRVKWVKERIMATQQAASAKN
jgi:hypothetical protein